jgi:hypothetical protein
LPRPRTLLAIGPDDADAAALAWLETSGAFRFVRLPQLDDACDPERCDPAAAVEKALEELGPDPSLDGVVAFDDYPGSLLAVAIAERLRVPGPNLTSSLLCHHKLWSRLIQSRVIPEAVPTFQAIDPQRVYRPGELQLPFPFWLKPVKASLSFLGFRIGSFRDFERACAAVRAELPSFVAAFDRIVAIAGGAPAGLPNVSGGWLIAEAFIAGRQCTLEGFVHSRRFSVLGVVDSIRLRNRVSFTRFDYPSSLPARTQRAMADLCARYLRAIDFDRGLFNAEFFVPPGHGTPMLIEVNPRFCAQFADLYERVDGRSGYAVLAELAAGGRPTPVKRRGAFRHAAIFVLRRRDDAILTRAPSDLEALHRDFPDAALELLVKPGERLSMATGQDSYTFRYALLRLGGRSRRELMRRFRIAQALLPFEFARVPVATDAKIAVAPGSPPNSPPRSSDGSPRGHETSPIEARAIP